MDEYSEAGTSGLSPVKKHEKGKGFQKSEKQKILNIYKTLLNDNPKLNITDIVNKVASSCGVSKASVYNILKEHKTTGELNSPSKTKSRPNTILTETDDFTKTAIRRKIHNFYFENSIPTIDRILAAVNEDPDLPNFKRTTLYKLFKYQKRERNSCLLERSDIVLWRRNYIRSIRKYRAEGRKIYYLDETWLNAGHTKSKVWQDKTIKTAKDAFIQGFSTGLKNPTSKGKHLIVLHIGSDTGFVSNGLLVFESKSTKEYHEEMCGQVFLDWFQKVLPELEPNCVVVMDNASYHSVKEEKLPTKSWNKSQMVAWLQSKNVTVGENMCKIELFDEIKKIRNMYDKYVIDELAMKNGIQVLRLPPYHCELNPIELVWSQVKGYVAQKNTSFKLQDVKRLLEAACLQVTPEKWASCVCHVIDVEEPRCWDLDDKIDSMEPFIINVADDSSSSD